MRGWIISLGDALRVCADLRPEDEDRPALRNLLGMEAETNTRAPVNLGAWLPSSSKNLMTRQRKATMEKEGSKWLRQKKISDSGAASSSPSGARIGSRSTLMRVSQSDQQPSAPAWFAQVPRLETLDDPGVNPPIRHSSTGCGGAASCRLRLHACEGASSTCRG